jgi:hypothetical protein
MTTVQEFANTFPSEAVLQQALAKLFSKIPGHSGVQILQGSQEIGKDIIFYTPGALGQKDLNAWRQEYKDYREREQHLRSKNCI